MAMCGEWLRCKVEDREKVIDYLADNTDGYSGADIQIICKAITYAPVRRLTEARYFRCGPDNRFEPAEQGDPGAVPATLSDLVGRSVVQPAATMGDAVAALRRVKSSVTPGDIDLHKRFAE